MSRVTGWDGPIIWECRKGNKLVRVRQRRYYGSDFLDFREFIIGDKDTPTRRGATIPLENISSLVAALIEFRPETPS